jgi:NCS1 family nucleobase:cation symporter-1
MTQTINQNPADLVEVREGEYGDRVAVVEPGGAEFIPLSERHGKPLQLFWTWMSPNFEFATVFVGVICISLFGLSFGQAVAAIVLGTVLGSITHGALSARGPEYGVPQMILSRISFGYWGNILPAGINALIAGIGWFAVNSVSGALALSTLTHMPKLLSLAIIAVAQILIALFGHNLVHAFERVAFPFLVVAFVLAGIWTFGKAHYGAPAPSSAFASGFAGFTLALGATFGYAVGWNPYASDYTRYFAADTSKVATGWWAGFGVALSCVALEIMGAASATIAAAGDSPTTQFTNPLPTAVADITLIAIAVGAVAANVLNIYSGSISFTTLGIRLHAKYRRAIIAAVFGVLGFLLAWSGLHDAGEKYENFLLIIAYWIGPWLAVYFTDQLLRRGNHTDLLYNHRHTSWSGPIAMAVGMAVSILLFSNQTEFTGFIVRNHFGLGDLTFEVGFAVSAVVYAIGYPIENRRRRTIALPA